MELCEEEEDKRREASLSSTPSLHSNFTPPGITTNQLYEFQELHKRRLQIKSKAQKNFKDNTKKSCAKHFDDKELPDKSLCPVVKESNFEVDEGKEHFALQKRRKLHWGLDTKERWERKANM